jgi:hypothetical protein
MQRKKARRSPRLTFDTLEPRQLLAADVYEPGFDPALGATVNAFLWQDPQNSSDSWDIETGWLNAVDELAQSGADQVNFSVFRQADNYGALNGGTHLDTVRSAVQRANEHGLTVSLLPLFETQQGWRGDYNPSGAEQTRFRNDYRQFVLNLASIEGVERLTVASELNAMHLDSGNDAFFDSLIEDVASSGFSGQIGVTANFDIYRDAAFQRVWSNPNIDFLGVSAYGSLIAPQYYDSVSATGPVSDATLQQMVDAWNHELDTLEAVAEAHELPVFIQEFGSVKKNYTSIFPWSVNPGDVVNNYASDRYADDPHEQAATYRSLLQALDGRGDRIIGVDFWSWEHQADRGQRSFDQLGGVINHFSVWPTDGAGGTEFVNFIATQDTSHNGGDGFQAVDDVFSETESVLDVLSNDSSLASVTAINDLSEGNVSSNGDGTLQLQSTFTQQELSSIGGEDGSDSFGHAVAIDGNLAVIGAPYHDSNFRINNGAVFVYELQNDQWQQVATVTSPTDKSGDLFGWSVDIQGDTIVVGSMHDDMFSFNGGAAYVLYQGASVGEWEIAQSLPASNVRIGDRFGVSVAIDSGLIAVGNRFANGAAINSGTVNVFRSNEFRQFYEADIVESPIATEAQFGWDLDLYNQQLVVGAPRSETGSAFLYQLNEWGQAWKETELVADSIRTGDRFGYSVSISEGNAFVGSTLHDHASVINSGAVYRYDLQGAFQQKLIQPSPKRGDQFGFAIDSDGLKVVASGVGIDSTGNNSGRVVEFSNENGAWVLAHVFDTERTSRSGHAIALDGDKAIVGVPTQDRVQTFLAEEGTQDITFDYTIHEAVIQLQGEAEDSFGWSIASTDQWAVVGAPTAMTQTSIQGGAVWVFKRSNDDWSFHSRLTPSTIGVGDHFGSSVDIQGNVLVVGSRLADTGNIDAGAAYVFELEGDQWNWTDRLFAADIDASDQFGYSVAVDGDRIVVGAIYDEYGEVVNSGTVTVFEKQSGEGSGWEASQTLISDSPEQGKRFGHDVSLSQSWLAVSSPVAEQTGKVYTWRLEGLDWRFKGALAASDTSVGDEFGNSLSIQGTKLVVGAWKHDHNGIWNSGAVYAFEWSDGQWQQQKKLVSEANFGSLIAWNRFGSSVDLDGGNLAVGSAFEDGSGEDSGAVYLFNTTQWDLTARFSTHESGATQGQHVSVATNFILSAGSVGNVAIQNTVGASASVTVRR